jgi:hypothetical protein
VAKRILCLVLVALLGASCDMQKLMKDLTAPQDLALADHCFELLRLHDFAGLKTKLSPGALRNGLDTRLDKLAAEIPDEAPLGSSLTSVNTNNTNGHRTVDLTEIYRFSKDWVQLSIRTQGDSVDAMQVDLLNVQRVAPPPAPSGAGGLTTFIVLAGIALWLVLMIVIYRRYARKAR